MVLVAKSYVGLPQIGEEYTSNGRTYIKVQLANGTLKQVRSYSEKEYEKYYGGKVTTSNLHAGDKYWKSQKNVLGFSKGYITIFKGDTYSYKEWFKEHGATFRKWWGWSIASTEEVPADLPEGVEALKLDWDLVGQNDETLKPDDQIKTALDSILYEDNGSEYVGNIGDRLDLELCIEKIVELEGYYGISTMYIMYDVDDNYFVWTTTSHKDWEEGQDIHIKGTVKDQKVYRNSKQTVLTRCKEV